MDCLLPGGAYVTKKIALIDHVKPADGAALVEMALSITK
jgi:hypothetical protein